MPSQQSISSRRPLTDRELEELYGLDPYRTADDWFDYYEGRPTISRRRKILIPIVALLVAGSAVFTAYAFTRNRAQGVADARHVVEDSFGVQKPALRGEPLPDRDRVWPPLVGEPPIGVRLSLGTAEVNTERTEEPEAPDAAAPSVAAAASVAAKTPERARTSAEPQPAPVPSPQARETEAHESAASERHEPIMAEVPASEVERMEPSADSEEPASSPVIEAPVAGPKQDSESPKAPAADSETKPRGPDYGI